MRNKEKRSRFDRILSVATVLAFATAIGLFIRPSAPLGRRLMSYVEILEVQWKAPKRWAELSLAALPLQEGAANYQVIMIADFQCAFCAESAPIVDSAIALGMSVGYLHMPAPSRALAVRAAELSVCAAAGGEFKRAFDHYFYTLNWANADSVELILPNVEDPRFQSCAQSDSAKLEVERSIRVASELGVRGTPVFVSRTGLIRGIPSLKELQAIAGAQ